MAIREVIEDQMKELGGCIDQERKRILLEHGRPFAGIARPKGYRRQWALKSCYRNAAELAIRGRGTYVEGLATLSHDSTLLLPHAWITVDGMDAIDQTWPRGENYEYFGIPFATETLARLLASRKYYGPLLEPSIEEQKAAARYISIEEHWLKHLRPEFIRQGHLSARSP
jgi:hypothetical protein